MRNLPSSDGALRRLGANLAPDGGERAANRDLSCAAPAGHVCQFAIKTGGSQMTFALPSGERKEVASITPHADKYCVCDPGPVTAGLHGASTRPLVPGLVA